MTALDEAAPPEARSYPPEEDGFVRYDLDMMLKQPPPPVEWIADQFLAPGAVTLFFGAPGIGKSLFSMALAGAITEGNTTCAGFPCRKSTVLVLDHENGHQEAWRRVNLLRLSQGIDYYEPPWTFDLLEEDCRDQLENLVVNHRPGVLILDSFRSLWSGNENHPEEVAPVLDPMRRMAHSLNLAILLLHHPGKGQKTPRGCGALEAAVEMSFRIGHEDRDPESNRRVIQCRKSRLSAPPNDRWVRLDWGGGLVYVDEAEPFSSADAPPKQPVRSKLRERVLELYESDDQLDWIPRAEMAKLVKRDPKDRTFRMVVDGLEDEGLIEREPGGGPVAHRFVSGKLEGVA